MLFQEQLRYALISIRKRKKEALMTGLGVMIGVAAIVAMVSLTQGFQRNIIGNLEEGLNTKTLTIMGSRGAMFERIGGEGGPGGGMEFNIESIELSLSDIDDLKKITHVVAAVAYYEKSIFVNASDDTFRTTIVGIDFIEYNALYTNFAIAQGSFPTNDNYAGLSVIGTQLQYPSDEYEYNLGDTMSITWTNMSDADETLSTSLKIEGILNEFGSNARMGGPSDTNLYIDANYFLEIFGSQSPRYIILLLDDDDSDTFDAVQDDINEFYGTEVSTQSAGSMVASVEETFETTQLLLGGIAAISLIVAGVGIMNIMTVSLMQRTREIGILKSLGTPERDILAIFLFEIILIGVFGSIVGLGVGWIMAVIVGSNLGTSDSSSSTSSNGPGGFQMISTSNLFSTQIDPYIGFGTLVLIFLFGISICLIFGLLPAWRASKLTPIEALREE